MLSAIPAAASTEALSNSDALLGLITTESLLFAALAVSVALAGEFKTGQRKLVRGPKLAWAITATIVAVSFGAMMALLELFASHCPHGFRDSAIAVTFAIGIVMQPVLAGWIASGIK
jgi:hypothetical protein